MRAAASRVNAKKCISRAENDDDMLEVMLANAAIKDEGVTRGASHADFVLHNILEVKDGIFSLMSNGEVEDRLFLYEVTIGQRKFG